MQFQVVVRNMAGPPLSWADYRIGRWGQRHLAAIQFQIDSGNGWRRPKPFTDWSTVLDWAEEQGRQLTVRSKVFNRPAGWHQFTLESRADAVFTADRRNEK